jgi:hypothetical protein
MEVAHGYDVLSPKRGSRARCSGRSAEDRSGHERRILSLAQRVCFTPQQMGAATCGQLKIWGAAHCTRAAKHPDGRYGISGPLKLPHCGLMPAIFTTLSHFAASAAM